MSSQAIRVHHWLVLGGLVLATAAAALLWSTRGLGHRNPHDVLRPVAEISRLSAVDRDAAHTRLLLTCLDTLAKAKSKEAIRYCSLVLEIDPRDVMARNLRGNAHIFLHEYALAIADFSRSTELSPHDPDAYRLRAQTYAAQHHDQLALADFGRAIALSPADPINVELRGHFYQSRNHYTLAITDFETVVAARPSLARAWNSLCWTKMLRGQSYSTALIDCDKAIHLDPANANAYDSKGFVLLRMNRFRSSIGSFDRALQRNSRLASSLLGRALAKLHLRDLTAAKDLAAAKLIEPAIESRFLRYGIKVPAIGPSGA